MQVQIRFDFFHNHNKYQPNLIIFKFTVVTRPKDSTSTDTRCLFFFDILKIVCVPFFFFFFTQLTFSLNAYVLFNFVQ